MPQMRSIVTKVDNEQSSELLKRRKELCVSPENYTLAAFLRVAEKAMHSRASEAPCKAIRAL